MLAAVDSSASASGGAANRSTLIGARWGVVVGAGRPGEGSGGRSGRVGRGGVD